MSDVSDPGPSLGAPPVTEKKLLWLGIGFAGLSTGRARMTGAARLFVITWAPLEHFAPRLEEFAWSSVSRRSGSPYPVAPYPRSVA